jgi:ADP-heptose:LPS heptosyltransferase
MDHEFHCRYFRGDKPCAFSDGRRCAPIVGEPPFCGHHDPVGERVLIIKLGALGDVLRTTTLLPAIQKRFPKAAITWITKPGAIPLLTGAGLFQVLPWELDSVLWAERIPWDLVICLDKEEGPTALASRCRATVRHGFGRNEWGFLTPLSPSTESLFLLGIDDEAKFRTNTRTYPALIADACALEWGPNPYVLELTEEELTRGRDLLQPFGDGPFVGLHVGAGDGFAGKRWSLERYLALGRELTQWGITPVFLAGTREQEAYAALRERFSGGVAAFPGCDLPLRTFAALVSQLKVLVSGDSLAMHVAIARGVYAVTLFGSTTEREIEFYGRGEALVGRVDCGPCYRRVCPHGEKCLNQIAVDEVFAAVQRGVKKW